MLWLCIRFPRLPFEALSLNDQELVVVTSLNKGRTRRIIASSKAAQALRIYAGMEFTAASALCAHIKGVERNSEAERKALHRLAAWAYQWSSAVVVRSAELSSLGTNSKIWADSEVWEDSRIWLEIEASFTLFGGRVALLKRIEEELKQLEYAYQLGIACSLEGAALLARAKKRVVAGTPAALRRHIAPLSIRLLALESPILCELQQAGIRTIDTLIELPKDAVARRFGPKTNAYLDRMLGLAPDPPSLFRMPKKYHACCELGTEVAHTEALLFPLRRILQEFQGYLRAIDGGVQHFLLCLCHRDGITRIAMGLSAPERRADSFFPIVRERLERLALSAPVLEIRLLADHFTAPAIRQAGIFSDAQESVEQFQHVLDKLTARLGEEAIHRYELKADYRPENSWTSSEIASSTAASVKATTSPRPLWLLTEPRRISKPTAALVYSERIASGWWDDHDIARDYYFLRKANGTGLWVYRDERNEWFVHGICG